MMVTSEQVWGLLSQAQKVGQHGRTILVLNDSALVAAFETVAKLVELETTVQMTREHLDAMEKGFIRKPVNPGLN